MHPDSHIDRRVLFYQRWLFGGQANEVLVSQGVISLGSCVGAPFVKITVHFECSPPKLLYGHCFQSISQCYKVEFIMLNSSIRALL